MPGGPNYRVAAKSLETLLLDCPAGSAAGVSAITAPAGCFL